MVNNRQFRRTLKYATIFRQNRNCSQYNNHDSALNVIQYNLRAKMFPLNNIRINQLKICNKLPLKLYYQPQGCQVLHFIYFTDV